MTEINKNLFKQQEVQNIIEDGEENLHKIYAPVQGRRTTRVLITGDLGSTQTRIKIVDIGEDGARDFDDAVGTTYVIPSDSVSLPKLGTYVPDSKMLYDNMASKIINLDDPNGFVPNTFLVRGNLAEKQNTSRNVIGSSGRKIQNPVLYLNILDGSGYALLQHFEKDIPEKVIIDLALALPPQDNTEKNIAFMKKSLKNFKWTHISGAKIEMEFENFVILTEPEAQAKAQQMMSEEDNISEQRKLTIEMGGRSIGLDIMKGYMSIPHAQRTLEYGGSTLIDMIRQRFEAKFGETAKASHIRQALTTGSVVLGKNAVFPIVDIIKASKDEFAVRIATDIRINCFDTQSTVTPQEITKVEMSGRTNAPGQYEYSLSQPLCRELTKYIKNAEFENLEDNLIPLGLLMTAVHRLGLIEDATEAVGFSDDDEDFSPTAPSAVAIEETTTATAEAAAGAEFVSSEETVSFTDEEAPQAVQEEESVDLDVSTN